MSEFRVMPPLTITPTNLTFSNVPEDEAPAYDPVAIYGQGQQVIFDHRVYESAIDGNQGAAPIEGGTTPWLDIGPTNRFAAFDSLIATQTVQQDLIEVEITPNDVINGVALFNVVAQTVQVIVTDQDDGEVYNVTKDMQDTTLIVDWFEYFFEPVELNDRVLFDDLPNYFQPTIRILIANPGAEAKAGVITVGKQRSLGITQFGTSFGIVDLSRVTRDPEFGTVNIVRREYLDDISYPVRVDTATANRAKRVLTNLRAIPTVFIGSREREESIVLGLYEGWRVVLENPLESDCSIDVKGIY